MKIIIKMTNQITLEEFKDKIIMNARKNSLMAIVLNLPLLNMAGSKPVEVSQKYKKPDGIEGDKYIIVNQSDEDKVSDLMYKFSYKPKQ